MPRKSPGSAGERISQATARRIVLAAQGFAETRPATPVGEPDLLRIIDRLGLLQLDSVNALCRAHYLPVFARIGPYPRDLLDQMAWGEGPRALFEFWGRAAAMFPVSTFPLLRWRMEAARRWVWEGWSPSDGWDSAIYAPWAVVMGMTRLARERPTLLDEVLALVAERGPLAAKGADPTGSARRVDDPGTGRMWNWQDAKIALEWLFCLGKVTTATRRNFERLYDLTERVIPEHILTAPSPSREDAQRELIRIAARVYGIATEEQLLRYFGLPATDGRYRIAELIDAHELIPACIEGRRKPMYLWATVSAPERIEAQALLSPFDPLIKDRNQTEKLFGFHYRISIYTPASERTHGYWVMPFLLGEQMVARVDLKADRERSALVVPTVNIERGARPLEVAAALADELRLLAEWLGLDRVVVGGRGDLAPALAAEVGVSG